MQLLHYLSYTDSEGNHLPVRDLAKLLDISKSRVGQLMTQLEGRFAHLTKEQDKKG